jgi:hypothetical protein
MRLSLPKHTIHNPVIQIRACYLKASEEYEPRILPLLTTYAPPLTSDLWTAQLGS